jgi:hypothetical protein
MIEPVNPRTGGFDDNQWLRIAVEESATIGTELTA